MKDEEGRHGRANDVTGATGPTAIDAVTEHHEGPSQTSSVARLVAAERERVSIEDALLFALLPLARAATDVMADRALDEALAATSLDEQTIRRLARAGELTDAWFARIFEWQSQHVDRLSDRHVFALAAPNQTLRGRALDGMQNAIWPSRKIEDFMAGRFDLGGQNDPAGTAEPVLGAKEPDRLVSDRLAKAGPRRGEFDSRGRTKRTRRAGK